MHTLYFSTKKELLTVEKIMEKSLKSVDKQLNAAVKGLLKSGGKRIRPLLVLLSGHFSNQNQEDVHKVSATLEMIHMSSLVHDDVIDDAPLRRGVPTIYAKYGPKMSMYCGDFIFGRAVILISSIGNIALNRVLSTTIKELCLGEIDQIRDKFDFEQNFRAYLRRIKRKTAILLSASCELGALASGLDQKNVGDLKRFGYYLGMSYQIIDDILDFTGDEKTIGKPAGGDLLQGNITLPALYALRNIPDLAKKIRKVSEKISKPELTSILEDIRQSGGIEYAYEVSDRYYCLAYREWSQLPDCPSKDALHLIAEKIRVRRK